MKKLADYTSMATATAEDYRIEAEIFEAYRERLPKLLIAQLEGLRDVYRSNKVDRYQHSLQTATRALRSGASEEMVVAALFHDIGDILTPDNHAPIAAELLKPYVGPDTYWIIKHHDVFQGYFFWHHWGRDRNARERFRHHPLYERAVYFSEAWDQTSFDPDYGTLPISDFIPMVERIFGRQPWQSGCVPMSDDW
uniref:Predicted HD phosphohydrolase n=1 Tax=Candidatus Kentrum sp. LFY TaxID=2126342 RepID=A0A450UDJ6_9GAMM|nr:MAG: Predicted HD phosphohydrolase [Candidatus Kentron sp. LFY]